MATQIDGKFKAVVRRMFTARAAIVHHIEEIDRLDRNVIGEIPCPNCDGGTLHFGYAGAYNRHIRAGCTTPDCTQFIE